MSIYDYQICYRGGVHDSTGISRATREYILALDRLGLDIKIEAVNYGTPPTELKREQADRLSFLVAKPYSAIKKKILIYQSQPNGIDPVAERASGKYQYVLINTVWETTKVPTNWFPNANTADALIVPSEVTIEALRDSGCTAPIYLVPHGADSETYKPDNAVMDINLPKDYYKFLSVFQWQHRKGADKLLQAYWEEFSADDKVVLILKTYAGGTKESGRMIRQSIGEFQLKFQFQHQLPMVIITTSNFSDYEMAGLYAYTDAFVLPTRGEGVGLPYIESLCTGKPVLATGWGGQTEYLNESNAYLIDYELENTRSMSYVNLAPDFHGLFTDQMKWAEPKLDSIKHTMRYVFEHQEEAKQKGAQGRKDMEGKHWDWVGEQFKNTLERIVSN